MAAAIRRDLRLAAFSGMGLRALGVQAGQLTETPGENYSQTRKWAQAAHAEGFDGLEWMSRQDNRDHAFVVFGDRVAVADQLGALRLATRLATPSGATLRPGTGDFAPECGESVSKCPRAACRFRERAAAGIPDVPVRPRAAAHGVAGAHRRPPRLCFRDRGAVRTL
ncbi:RES family NAD+ phosphorylase [Pseudarthrobacter albicanus]|uniref:RES family NAD+ phosphorylase n=1 Tax=Pseudarthrobacter albicanus TaxID=2823873 RepID=UPI001BA98100